MLIIGLAASYCRLPQHLRTAFSEMPEDECPPDKIWGWIMWRSDWLERADERVEKVLQKASQLAP